MLLVFKRLLQTPKLCLRAQKNAEAILRTIQDLQKVPMHLETLHVTHIGRTLTSARKRLETLVAQPELRPCAETALALACSTLEVWRDLATSANHRLKQRRIREAISDVANGSSMTPFERMNVVKEIKTAGRVEKKFGAGFDTSRYTTGQQDTCFGRGEACDSSEVPTAAAGAADPARAGLSSTISTAKPKHIPQHQGRLGAFFKATNTKGVSLSSQRAVKRFNAHASAHVAEKKRQSSLKQRTHESSSSEGELSDIG